MLSEFVVRHARLEAELHDKSRRRDAFLGTLSHELRNPLAGVRFERSFARASESAMPRRGVTLLLRITAIVKAVYRSMATGARVLELRPR